MKAIGQCANLSSVSGVWFYSSNIGKALSLGNIRRYPFSKKMKGEKERKEVQLAYVSSQRVVRLGSIEDHVVAFDACRAEYTYHFTSLLQ